MKQLMLGVLLCSILTAAHAEEPDAPRMSFQNPITIKGAEGSLVRDAEAAVIIPGSTHEDLWVHPNLVTVSSNPLVIEFSIRSTDRHGRDNHTKFNYFRTDDDFKTLQPISKRTEQAWRRVGLTLDDFTDWQSQVPEMKRGTWHWARNSVHLNAETILYPYVVLNGKAYSVRTLAARKSGDQFQALYGSNGLTNNVKRGFLEPQIAMHADHLYMTMRAEDGFGYVTTSDDQGRTWQKAQPWAWDDGEKVAMQTTMTKLLSHSNGLVLVYTRIRDGNHNVFRNRAPLHCAEVDLKTLRLKRSTERIIVPNKGKPIGNFWVWPINQEKSYVAVAEWERNGQKKNGDTWLVKINWKQPNKKMTPVRHEQSAP